MFLEVGIFLGLMVINKVEYLFYLEINFDKGEIDECKVYWR